MPTVSYGIAATADDAVSAPEGPNSSSGLAFGLYGTFTLYGGLRFLGVAVSPTDNITAATVTLTRHDNGPALFANPGSSGATAALLRGVNVANQGALPADLTTLSTTSASATITNGATVTVDVLTIVKAIQALSGWASGNAMAFVGDPTGATGFLEAYDYSSDSAKSAVLSITYDAGAGGGATPSAANHAHVATSPSLTASTNLTFQGTATGTTTATLPAHQAGDLIVAFAFRDGSNTQPTIPAANWSPLQNATGANTCSHVLVSKVAASSSETVGTFTNATSVVVQVYRPKAGYALSVGANGSQGGTATSITYPAMTLQDTGGTSWVAAFGGHRSVNTALENPPAGMVQRATVVDATDEAAGFDTNSGVAAWSAQSVALGGTASGWRSSVVEIKVATAPNPSSGPDNAAQAQAATSPAFTAKSTINPDAAAQAHLSGSPNLSVGALSIAPTGGSQSQTSTLPGLVGRSALIPAGADQSQVATEPTLAARASTLAHSATHSQTTTPLALLFGATIQPTNSAQGQSSSAPSLGSRATVAPQTATQAQGTSTAALTPSGSIGLQSSSQGQAATSAALASRAAVAVDPATSGQSASEPNLNVAAAVAVEAGVSWQIATPAPITSRSVVAPDDAQQASLSSLPTIVWRGDLPPVPPIRHVVLTGRRRTASLTARVRFAPLTGRTRKIIR